MGFFTDTTVCIGCKACEVACKQWNRLPAAEGGVTRMSGHSYDNTRRLDSIHWRHVKFIEQFDADRRQGRWLMFSDVCKHCTQAPCLAACPTGAIVRTEFGSILIRPDVCKGIGRCVDACPFNVLAFSPPLKIVRKCTLCYDRIKNGLEPACAKTCPTDAIRFGPLRELIPRAERRVEQLHARRETRAYLYGADRAMLGGLHSFYLLVDRPEVYGLPAQSVLA
ncbi:MAG: 4Fe-4S dicluster domain-containing protein [Desulfobacterales bacterium]|nr:4Fe-4S dicluster domain-containing protein [Desulfobacterales bacterium]